MSEHICELTAIDFETWDTTIGVEVVRCRDCKHGREHDMRSYGGRRDQFLCHHFSMSSGAGWPVEPDGFCAWGSRK